jgi:glycine/D-amino acid oxidase-like deaminating enzyme
LRSATIVGAGAFGAWTAHALAHRGWKVTLVDHHGPANGRASSGGETRIIRSGYGALSLYARWAQASLAQWLDLEQRSGERLFVRTGALFLGSDSSWLSATAATLRAEQIPAEWLDVAELARRYPQLHFPEAAGGLLEPQAGALFARRGVQALVRSLLATGVVLGTDHIEPEILIRQSGADALIFACGAWLPSLFPEVLGHLIFPTRQEVFFFGTPAGDTRFSPSHLPAWVLFDEGVYGLPDLAYRGVKVAIDAHGPEADPERMDRTPSEASLERIREVLRRRLPALAEAPLLEARVCQYENTSNGHFLIDRLPDHDRVWIVGGGSGHGFKHGPAVGRYVADLIDEQGEAERLFAIAGRPPRQRAVY